MLRLLALILILTAALPAHGGDTQFARFDATRVFDEYQHTKDIRPVQTSKHDGPEDDLRNRARELKEKSDAITAKLQQAPAGTPERDHLAQEEKIAALEYQVALLQIQMGERDRLQKATEKLRKERTAIIAEIWAEARLLGTERGYLMIYPEKVLPHDGFELIIFAKSDDLTDELLQRLNTKYAAKK